MPARQSMRVVLPAPEVPIKVVRRPGRNAPAGVRTSPQLGVLHASHKGRWCCWTLTCSAAGMHTPSTGPVTCQHDCKSCVICLLTACSQQHGGLPVMLRSSSFCGLEQPSTISP